MSPWKQRVLGKMVEKCAGNLAVDQKEQLSQLLLEYADIFADEAVPTESHTVSTLVAPHLSGSQSAVWQYARGKSSRICSRR